VRRTHASEIWTPRRRCQRFLGCVEAPGHLGYLGYAGITTYMNFTRRPESPRDMTKSVKASGWFDGRAVGRQTCHDAETGVGMTCPLISRPCPRQGGGRSRSGQVQALFGNSLRDGPARASPAVPSYRPSVCADTLHKRARKSGCAGTNRRDVMEKEAIPRRSGEPLRSRVMRCLHRQMPNV
jgi:hypothetical protein